MNIAQAIVAKLLNEEHFDVRQHPELYEPLGKKNPAGQDVFRTCTMCEIEHGADKQYGPDVNMSHGQCRRHIIQQYMQYLGYSREQAEAKVGTDCPPDWNEAREAAQAAAPAPKATFWATSGSGA